MPHTKVLLLLALLCAAETGRALKLYNAASVFSCLNAALTEAQKGHPDENDLLDKRSLDYPPQEEAFEED
ncbi:UCN3 protein, partial [Eudromia elegans]|nr:UCN3 protein [Eudromia elegans]